jgi:hypothetical protein
MSGSFQLLAGCEVDGLYSSEVAKNNLAREDLNDPRKYEQAIFDRGLFATWGDACLALRDPGTFYITVEQANDSVIASPCEPDYKTAVGTKGSPPLAITVVR